MGSEYQIKFCLSSVGDGEVWRVLDREEEGGQFCLLTLLIGHGAHKRQGKTLSGAGGVSSPLGGPGAAREGAWADLRGLPWATPFRVGSEKEKGKDTRFECLADQTWLLAPPTSPVHLAPSQTPGPSGSLALPSVPPFSHWNTAYAQ